MQKETELIENIITELLPKAKEQPASNTNESHFYLLRAALEYGYNEPFSAELDAMNQILAYHCVGRELAREAWRLVFERNFKTTTN